MRNLKRALSLALATVMTLGLMVVGTGAVGYQDVDRSDNQEAIEVLQAVGIMTGVTDDEFDPDGVVTRNQMAVIMSQLLNLDYDYYRGINTFTDVPAWAAPYVAACVAEGVTAGIGNNLYGGENNVTAAQAALMLMKALGYFQYQGDFNPDWQVATVRQASYIGLFDGVDSNADAALTRGQVAQMVLNALKADMVYFTGTVGTELTLPDGTKYTAGYVSEYTPRTSSDRQYNTLIDDTSDIAGTDRYIIQLGEELYDGDLRQTASSDAFMRPATTWRYDNETIGTYPDEADVSYTAAVKVGTIYNDLGLDKGIPSEDIVKYEDGNDDSWNPNLDLVKGETTKIGGNGALTEVYYDAADDTVLITVTNTYVAKVTAARDETSTREAYVTLSGEVNTGKGTSYETEDFAKDDIVLYTYSYKTGDKGVQSMELAESVTGAMSRYTTEGSVTVADEKYDANCKSVSIIKDYVSAVDKGDDVTAYLDNYGYVVYVDADTTAQYAVVLEMVRRTGDFNDTVKAKLLLSDGTIVSKEVVSVNDEEMRSRDDNFNGQAGFSGTTNYVVATTASGKLSLYDIVSYKVNSDDEYELTVVADSITTTVDNSDDKTVVENGKNGLDLFASNNANLISGGVTSGTTDGATIFLFYDGDDATVYEGFANVPTVKVDQSKTTYATVYRDAGTGDDTIADVVFILDTDDVTVSDGNEDVIYVKGNNDKASYTTALGEFYEYDGFLNGDEIVVRSEDPITEATLIYGPSYNSKDILVDWNDSVKASDGTDTAGTARFVTGTKAMKNDVISLGNDGYTYVSDVDVYYVTVDGELEISDIASIGDDDNDQVFFTVDSEERLTTVYVKVVDEDVEDPTPDGNGDYAIKGTGGGNYTIGLTAGRVTLSNAKVVDESITANGGNIDYESVDIHILIERDNGNGWYTEHEGDITVDSPDGASVNDWCKLDMTYNLPYNLRNGDYRVTLTVSNDEIEGIKLGPVSETLS